MGGATKWNPGGTWPTGDRRTSCTRWRAAYKACSWLSAPIDVTARTITAGGVVVTPDEDADQVFADDPEQRPQDGPEGSKFDRTAQAAPHETTVDEADLGGGGGGGGGSARGALAPRARRVDDRGQTARAEQDAAAADEPPGPEPGVDVEDNRPQTQRRPDNAPPRLPIPPPGVIELRRLLKRPNPRQSLRQLLRGVVLDLRVYGDSFTEVVWLLGKPVALYSLDSSTMSVESDEHGEVTGYIQELGDTREARFEPHQVIHIAEDSPDGSLYGLGVAAKATLAVETWLYVTALIRQKMKLGDPPSLHAHFGMEADDGHIKRFRTEHRANALGIENLGNPSVTVGHDPNAKPITELQRGQHGDLLAIQTAARDTIVSACGVPPAKVDIIESGNLGGGTGSDQDRTFHVNTCGPLAELIMEGFNQALLPAFDIDGWSMSIEDMDWRDDKALEEIRDMRLRNGSWTLNRYLAEIGEPMVDPAFGDVHVIVPHTPTEAQLWNDLPEASGLAIDAMRQAAKPQPAQGVPSVDKDGNPVPAGHPSQVPPNHPAAVSAVKQQREEQAAQLAAATRHTGTATTKPGKPTESTESTESAAAALDVLIENHRATALAAAHAATERQEAAA